MAVSSILCVFYLELCVILIRFWSVWSHGCNNGSFIIGTMTECHPWLTCDGIRHLGVGELIGFGAVKHVYQAVWQNNMVAISFLNNKDYRSDFLYGTQILKQIGSGKHIVQLVGFCEEVPVVLTEYHPAGSSVNLNSVFEDNSHSLRQRFQLCIDYVKILRFLHSSPAGPLMMCDSSTLVKTLEQYLLTSSGKLILNDVDALAKVEKGGTVCGHRELYGDFVAPEQKWPFQDKFRTERMPPYSEKADVWKIPPVCSFFLGKSDAAQVFRYHVQSIHRKCRERDPNQRPSAGEVLQAYETLYWSYFTEKGSEKEEL